MTKDEIEALIQGRFEEMPPKIKAAARYVLDSPKEIALQSMRSVASDAGLHPASMLRLARELGFDSYEAFKSVYVDWVTNQDSGLVGRTIQLRNRSKHNGAGKSLTDFLHTELINLDRTLSSENESSWIEAEQALAKAKNVYIIGLRSLFSAAYYFHYVLSTFRKGVNLVHGTGGTVVDELRRIGRNDVLVCFTSSPYTVISMQAATLATERGATLIAISDSTVSPVASKAAITILAPNSNLGIFPSIVPHMAVAHTLAQMMVSNGGEDVLAEVSNSDAQLKKFGVYIR
ncbi:MAG: MurR/RpiR family transcriptional regulator [Burkholderiaceae bacterium]